MVKRVRTGTVALGEMNPEQTRETTMNPEKCGSLPVRVEDKVEAYETFTTLRGDIVNPRREPAKRTPSTSLRVNVNLLLTSRMENFSVRTA